MNTPVSHIIPFLEAVIRIRAYLLSFTVNQIKDLDILLDELQPVADSLNYLSLLGNEACPDQLSNSDKDDDDYNRYRQVCTLSTKAFLQASLYTNMLGKQYFAIAKIDY